MRDNIYSNLPTITHVDIDKEELTEVVRLAMSGDEGAFGKLVEAFSNYILGFVANLVINREETEDAAQEVILQIYKSIGKLQSPYAFTSWLRRLMIHVVDNYNDKNARHLNNREDMDDDLRDTLVSEEASPFEQAAKANDYKSLYRLVMQLPKMQRTSVYLYYYEDLSYKEIAKILGVNQVTVGTNIRKARANLVKKMNKNNMEFGSVIAGAFALNVESAVAPGAAEALKAYAHTMDKSFALPHGTAGKTSGSKLWTQMMLGGVALTAAAALTFALIPHAQDKPTEPVSAPVQKAETIVYTANGANIDFVTDGAKGANVDPISAQIMLSPQEEGVVVNGWRLLDESGKTIASGAGGDMTIPELSKGKYSLAFDVVKDNVATSTVTRIFHITG